jgi:hypothetical protein
MLISEEIIMVCLQNALHRHLFLTLLNLQVHILNFSVKINFFLFKLYKKNYNLIFRF